MPMPLTIGSKLMVDTVREHSDRAGLALRSVQHPSSRSVEVIADLSRGLLHRISEMTDRLILTLEARDETYRERKLVPDADLLRSVSDNLREYVSALTSLPDLAEASLEVARATGRRRAEQGLPLESLLRAYRVGGIVVWEELLIEASACSPPPTAELLEGAVLVWEMTDRFSSEVGTTYQRTQAELHRRDATQRQTLLHSLLTGMASEADLAFAADVLDLTEAGPYLVAVAEPGGETGDSLAAALSARGIRSEWLLRQDRLVGVLSPRAGGSESSRHCLEGFAKLRAGLSPEVESLRQVGSAYRLAELALKAIPPHRIEVASLDDRLTSVFLVASPDLAQRLVRRSLGAVMDLGPGERGVLLRTLRLYVQCGGSVAKVASRVPCHRNTVFNRLARIQDLTHLSPADPRNLAQLALALEAIELLSITTDHQ